MLIEWVKRENRQNSVISIKSFYTKTSRNLENQNNTQGTRKSSRYIQRKDYKVMHSGSDIIITVGSTVVSEHMALHDHQEGDVIFKLLDFERN